MNGWSRRRKVLKKQIHRVLQILKRADRTNQERTRSLVCSVQQIVNRLHRLEAKMSRIGWGFGP